MNTQLSTQSPSSSYAYVSSRFPCFYDAWVHHLYGSKSGDTEVYLSLLPRNNDSPVIVDLFTGSGRVLKEIIASGRIPGGALLYGIDHSMAMLARASATTTKTAPTGGVRWRCEFATSFASALGGAKADLLIASAGSVSHLTHRDEVRGFLTEISRALAVGGVAVVSVLTEMLAGACIVEDDVGLLKLPCEDNGEGRKGRWVKSPTAVSWDDVGRVRTDTFQVEFYEDGSEDVVWREELKWALATFSEEEWALDVAEARLEIVEIVPESQANIGQRFYVLKASGEVGS